MIQYLKSISFTSLTTSVLALFSLINSQPASSTIVTYGKSDCFDWQCDVNNSQFGLTSENLSKSNFPSTFQIEDLDLGIEIEDFPDLELNNPYILIIDRQNYQSLTQAINKLDQNASPLKSLAIDLPTNFLNSKHIFVVTIDQSTNQPEKPESSLSKIGKNIQKVPEPLTILGTGIALGFGAIFQRRDDQDHDD